MACTKPGSAERWGNFDIGAATLPAQALGHRPRTSSLDGGGMLGGQFPRGDKDEANAPAWSAVVCGGRRKDQEQRVVSREGDSAIVPLIQWSDELMGRYFNSDAQQSGKSSRRGGAIPPPRP